ADVLPALLTPGAALCWAPEAGSEGEGGKYFVWTPAAVARVADSRDVELVCRYWDISEEGNFEGRSIPHVTLDIEQVGRLFGRAPDDAAAAIASARRRLLAVRGGRVPPLRDEKILVGWNGLMIGTLAEAGRVLSEPRYVAAATAAAEFLWSSLRDGPKLLHGWAAGRAGHGAYLDDHALLGSALVDLYEASGDRVHLSRALELVAALDARFHD